MSKFTSPLNNLRIASPCSADWDQMVGDNRQRYCGDCKLNVYNLSHMTRREAEDLILHSEGRICIRIYRRADGTILTKDCPVGWSAVKQRVSKFAAAFASLVFTALGGIGLANYFADSFDDNRTMGAIAIENQNFEIDDNNPMMGAIKPKMGEVAVEIPDIEAPQMGKVVSPDYQIARPSSDRGNKKRDNEKNR